jgi:hypothetical protein
MRPTKDPHTRPATQTLERLHAELGGKILENKQPHEDLAEQWRHVEACIKMLDPSYNRSRPGETSPAEPLVQAGHRLRAVDVLRTATEPLTAREIAERVLAAANVTNPNEDALADLAGSVLASLRNHKGKGIERTNQGAPARWSLAAN